MWQTLTVVHTCTIWRVSNLHVPIPSTFYLLKKRDGRRYVSTIRSVWTGNIMAQRNAFRAFALSDLCTILKDFPRPNTMSESTICFLCSNWWKQQPLCTPIESQPLKGLISRTWYQLLCDLYFMFSCANQMTEYILSMGLSYTRSVENLCDTPQSSLWWCAMINLPLPT